MSDATSVCPACHDIALLAEKIQVCPHCEAVYHDQCWRQQGGRCRKTECAYTTDMAETFPSDAADGPPPIPTRGSLPVRVKSGHLSNEFLRIETVAGSRDIPWSHLKFMAVGIIELDLTIEMPRSAMRAMIRKLMGDETSPNSQRRQIRETYLLDIYAQGVDSPLRIDSSVVNYRTLLGEVSFQSQRNFLQLVHRLVKAAPDVQLDASAVALLENKRYGLKRYTSIYEFEMETNITRHRPDQQKRAGDVRVQDGRLAVTDWEE